MAVHLNPLTSGTVTAIDGSEILSTKSFAPGRSYRPLHIARAAYPEAYHALLSWLRGESDGELPSLEADFWTAATFAGLFVSKRELASTPSGARPELGDGHGVAAALCPEVDDFLAGDPVLPELAPSLAADLAARGMAELPALLDGAGLAAVRSFYRTLADGGWTTFDREQTGRRVIHNDPVGRHVLCALTPLIGQLVRAPVKPSYSFAAEYRAGDELPRHTDRAQCEYTVSLFVDHRPGGEGEPCPWPLVIHALDGDVVAGQPAGGGPIFRGRELPHSRPPLGAGQTSQMLFLHYVPADFAGSLD